jgi:uncharacterized protein (TIGR02302 family)
MTLRGLRLRLRLARAAILWEYLWPAAWPAVALAGGFAVLALFDLLPLLPGGVHAAVLGLFAAGFAAAAIRAAWRLAWPDPARARRRLELSSGLPHRPLQALGDRPSGALDRDAVVLWEAHRRRMERAIQRLRVGWPAAGLARRDPWGIRAILAILLIIAAVDAGADWRDRVAHALTPNFAAGPPVAAASFDLWITPPDYTGLAPQFLRAGETATVRVPTGSALLAQVHGGSGVPQLAIDGKAQAFEAIDKDNFRFGTTLTAGSKLAVSQGGTVLGAWPIAIVPDNPPTIAFAEPPKGTPRAVLRLHYQAGDDYGIESVKAVIRRPDAKDAAPIELELPLPGLHLKDADATSYHDFSPHPWAGLPVELRLSATDAAGQTGHSAPVRMILPERVFTNPIARAIIDQRKELVKDPAASHQAVAEILGDLDKRPKLFHDDTVVFLALNTARSRLAGDPDRKTIDSMVELLWDTALRVEDGNMSLAERDVRRLQRELQDALARGAPDAEIDRLMNELRDALDRYLQALAQDLQRQPNENTEPIDPSRLLTRRDLQNLLDRARDLAHSGARDQARELLSQLQNMLENLRAARSQDGRAQGGNAAQQMMRGMQDLMQRQQQLLDRSFRAQRGRSQPGTGQPGAGRPGEESGQPNALGEMGEAAGQQEALRHSLGEMMRHLGDALGDIPDPFGRAERAMRDATGALSRGDPGDAIGPQTEALDQLQQGARDFARQLQEKLGNSEGNGEVGATDRAPGSDSERDPFGRPLSSNGMFDQGDVAIPDENTFQKARKILDELRRRAGQRDRPAIELDYIDRLLKRF